MDDDIIEMLVNFIIGLLFGAFTAANAFICNLSALGIWP